MRQVALLCAIYTVVDISIYELSSHPNCFGVLSIYVFPVVYGLPVTPLPLVLSQVIAASRLLFRRRDPDLLFFGAGELASPKQSDVIVVSRGPRATFGNKGLARCGLVAGAGVLDIAKSPWFRASNSQANSRRSTPKVCS